MIKKITTSDISVCAELGKKFWYESNAHIFFGEYNQNYVEHMFIQQLASGLIVGWVAYSDNNEFQGGLIAIKDNIFWKNVMGLKEIAWYIDPKYRGSFVAIRLYKTMEKYAKNHNMKFISMGSIKGTKSYEKMEKFYLKNNFSKLEETYVKVL